MTHRAKAEAAACPPHAPSILSLCLCFGFSFFGWLVPFLLMRCSMHRGGVWVLSVWKVPVGTMAFPWRHRWRPWRHWVSCSEI